MKALSPKQLLLAVSGMSPQVITETLFGIAQQIRNGLDIRWPDEIRIITTAHGKNKIEQALIAEGWLEKLCREVEQPTIALRHSDILVVPGAGGEPVVDARCSNDHEALADFITTTVRDLTAETANDNTEKFQIHASIAGGRKTMAFYLGYAISLFGRHFDQMSHVLVSEGFEGLPDFYFPTQHSHPLLSSDGQLDARDATVTLADIPFVRIRHSVPELLTRLGEHISYRQLVSLINLGDQPQRICLMVNTKNLCIQVHNGDYSKSAVCKVDIPNPVYMAFYLLLIEDTVRDAPDRQIYCRPSNSEDAQLLMEILLVRLELLLGEKTDTNDVQELCAQLVENYGLAHPNLERTLSALLEKGGLDKQRFNNYLTNIREAFSKALPINLLSVLLPSPLFNDVSGEICHKTKRSGGHGYGLNLQARQIHITK